MVLGHIGKPIPMVAGALNSPGTLQSVVLFTVVAAAELLLNNNIFACPCRKDMATLYGLSFLLVPAAILFLADFPWKLFRSCPPPGLLFSVCRRPAGLAITWIIIGSLQRKYIDCMLQEKEYSCDSATANNGVTVCCEKSVRSTVFQLVGLYVWLIIIIVAFVSLLCRRQKQSCMSGRSSSLEIKTKYEIDEKVEREHLIKKIKYGTTRLMAEGDLNIDDLKSIQPGLNPRTFGALQSEELLQPSVLSYLREEDLGNLDISVAQRCLLRALISTVRQNPETLRQFSGRRNKLGNDVEANMV